MKFYDIRYIKNKSNSLFSILFNFICPSGGRKMLLAHFKMGKSKMQTTAFQ